MKSNLGVFLQILEGSWISQKTTYYLKINQICSNQFKYLIHNNKYSTYNDNINILYNNNYYLQYYKNYIKQADTYSFNQIKQNNSGNIEKKKNNNLNNYKYSMYNDKCLKIQYTVKNIEYIEYINAINKKFIISIAFLKKFNKYIAISFSSNIKIKEINTR